MLLTRAYQNAKQSVYFCESAGDTKIGATRRFLLFGTSFDDVSAGASDASLSRFRGIPTPVVDVGVSGGVLSGADPVDETEGFRVVP